MFTLFDALEISAIGIGMIIGAKHGYVVFGTTGAVMGSVIGGGIGFLAGRLPWVLGSRWVNRRYAADSNERLRERLRSGKEYFVSHILLAHLMSRGENVADELPCIVALINSEYVDRRHFGWAALKLAFPDRAQKIASYQPSDSTEKCRSVVSLLD